MDAIFFEELIISKSSIVLYIKLIMLTILTLQQQKRSTHTHKIYEKVLLINNNKNVSQSAVCIQLQYLILEYHDKKQVLPGKT